MSVSPEEGSARRFTAKRKRRSKRDAEIVLLCNPRAGGRWKELASILDSEEAKFTRRIVTDSVEDVAAALDDVAHDCKLLCIYGGDGTIQRILDRLAPGGPEEMHMALLGGGTMNVTSRWCGFTPSPVENFRHVVRAYRSGDLLLKEVPLLEVQTPSEFHRGFTFGMGPIIRLLNAYENGRKGKVAAVVLGARAIAAAWLKHPVDINRLLAPMHAEVRVDGEALEHGSFSAVFANVTGQINPGVEPFVGVRTRESFHYAAYAVNAREMVTALPLLARGWLPLDVRATLKSVPFLGAVGDDRLLPKDPRYVNSTATTLEIRSEELMYTLDGEILVASEGPVKVGLGPMLKLAVGPSATAGNRFRKVADAVRG